MRRRLRPPAIPRKKSLRAGATRIARRCLSAFAFDRADAGYWQTNRAEGGGLALAGWNGRHPERRFDRRAESERREIPPREKRGAIRSVGRPEVRPYGTSLSTDNVAVVDRATDQRAGAGAEDRTEHFRLARGDDRAEHAAGHGADDQTSRAIVPLAVVTIV